MEEKTKADADEYRLRTQAEITLLVWVRTSLALMGFGFVVARFGLFLREISQVRDVPLRAHPRLAMFNSTTGTVLISLGVVVLVTAAISHQRFLARLDRGELRMPSRWSAAVLLSFFLAALGVGIALYLSFIEI